MKKFQFVLLCLALFGCSPPYHTIKLEPGGYTLVQNNKELVSFVAPDGQWSIFRYKDEAFNLIEDHMTIMNGRSSYYGVGFESRIGLENIERFEKKKTVLIEALSSGNLEKVVNKRLKEFYTEDWMKEVGVTEVKGSLSELAGFSCYQFEETQNYGPNPNNPKWGNGHLTRHSILISCPMMKEGEVWQLFSYNTITIATNYFNQHYGPNAPSVDEIKQDLFNKLQPMYDSIVVHGNPDQMSIAK
jgi:hypothetical protein